MKGYVILDNDNNLSFKDGNYIDNYDPVFWSRNAHLVSIVWPIDTEDVDSMLKFLTSLKMREFSLVKVKDICSALSFDLNAFLEDQKKPDVNKI
jgi:hypothetical protein